MFLYTSYHKKYIQFVLTFKRRINLLKTNHRYNIITNKELGPKDWCEYFKTQKVDFASTQDHNCLQTVNYNLF